MGKTVVVAADTSTAGRAAVRHAGDLARERDGVVHVVGASALHADRAARELADSGVQVHHHVIEGQLEHAMCEVARHLDAVVVSTAASATRLMQRRRRGGSGWSATT